MKKYECIVIGAGAAGLFYAAGDTIRDPGCSGRRLIIEKTSRPGQKLLMSENGMCNITHGGSIKDFVDRYGPQRRFVRSCLYRHNNLELMSVMESLGVPLTERADGKIFPSSLKAWDVLDALLAKAGQGGWETRYSTEVTSLRIVQADGSRAAAPPQIEVSLPGGTALETSKLIIATGGASYPATGSDGSFFEVLRRDLGLCIAKPRPALTPVYVQDYRYAGLSGISFQDVEITCGGHTARGPMLITHKGFSGPAVLHISQYVRPGMQLHINHFPSSNIQQVYQKIRSDQPGNKTGISNYISSEFGLPKAFAVKMLAAPQRRLCDIGHKELENITRLLMDRIYSVSGTGGWNDAMVTAGGVSTDQINPGTMSLKKTNEDPSAADLRIIGEVLDINGDTGGYNLQFAYSSAMAALD